ncbi:hypothetical protein P22_1033 [Propionispora sp. 2/2-37]|uniref:Ger(x)C family spore germination protein n=1 Tax=Propionispora sp. 2/2-37 TaxID=1677858 RepID=UPI0006BB79C8|nr:Ger(x)C family spore germination protein [Propionispora sp. 2/2-37]CUH94964.1 hypothetical protein P22_1033 [Propionispora sp. 2/2-37]
MYFRLIGCMLLGLTMLLNAGCSGARETDETGFVLALGVDKSNEDGMVKYTCQIAVPQAGSPEEGKSDDSKGQVSVSVEARSLAEARNLFNSSLARTLDFSHMKVLIIGEELARQGINDIFAPLMRYRDMRGSTYIVITNQITAEEYIQKNKPILEQVMSRYYESMMFAARESGYYMSTNLHEFYIRLKDFNGAPYATLVGSREEKQEDKPEGSLFPEEISKEYTAGNLSGIKGNPDQAMGLAVFSGDRLAGKLTNEETRMVAILRGEFPTGFYVLADPLVPEKFINLSMRLNGKPDVKLRRIGEQIFIDIKIKMEGEITAIPSGINYEDGKYRNILENSINTLLAKQMMKMIDKTQGWGCDVAGFGVYLRPQVTTQQELMALDWKTMYRQAEVNVSVNTVLRRTGLMQRTVPVRN